MEEYLPKVENDFQTLIRYVYGWEEAVLDTRADFTLC